jgi:hypothetical protein
LSHKSGKGLNECRESLGIAVDRVETLRNVINIVIRDLDVLPRLARALDDNPALIARVYAQANFRTVT